MSSNNFVQNKAPVMQQRTIRSFVKRVGRQTKSQKYALEHYMSQFGLQFDPDTILDFNQLFPELKKIKLEIGFGNGDSLVKMAGQDDSSGYIGVEVHTPGVGNCLKQIHEQGIANLRLMSHDAIEVMEFMIPEKILDNVFLFFPDPWHKKRHHKRRIVNQQFRDLLVMKCKQGAVLHMATDWQEYAEYMSSEMLADSRFVNQGNEKGFSQKPDYRPETKFEQRGHRLGHGVWDLLFKIK